jgi:hypothetical protein
VDEYNGRLTGRKLVGIGKTAGGDMDWLLFNKKFHIGRSIMRFLYLIVHKLLHSEHFMRARSPSEWTRDFSLN